MKLLFLLLVVPLLLTAFPSAACSIARPLSKFVPDQAAFEKAHDFYIAFDVPAPVVRIREFSRASSTSSGNCHSLTWVTLEIGLPPDSPFDLKELGFLFRTPRGPEQDRFMAFPNFPIVSSELTPDGKATLFTFALTDPTEARSRPFSLDIEVQAINGGLQVSEPSPVNIGGAER